MRRPRHIDGDILGVRSTGSLVGNRKAACHGSDSALERLSRFHGLALIAGPGAEPALPWTGMKVGVILGIRKGFDLAFGAHLAVAVIPMKYGGRPAGGLEVPSLSRPIVGVKNDTAVFRVDVLAKDDTRGWVTARVHGRQNHGVGIGLGGICLSL